MDYAYWRLLSKDVEPHNGPVHFRSSGILLLNLAGIKYKNNVHNICSHKTIKQTFSFKDNMSD